MQPREALLKYAKVGEDNPQWTTGVWLGSLFQSNLRQSDGDGRLFVDIDVMMAFLNSA